MNELKRIGDIINRRMISFKALEEGTKLSTSTLNKIKKGQNTSQSNYNKVCDFLKLKIEYDCGVPGDTLAEQIKHKRKSLGFSQINMAKKIKVPRATFQRIENGDSVMINKVIDLCIKLDLDLSIKVIEVGKYIPPLRKIKKELTSPLRRTKIIAQDSNRVKAQKDKKAAEQFKSPDLNGMKKVKILRGYKYIKA